MLVVDSSAWIEWLLGSAAGQSIDALWPPPEELLVPTIVQFELMKWAQRERGSAEAGSLVGFTNQCVVLPIDTALALAGARFASQHKLAIADALIYATAQSLGAELLTCDRHFEGLPGVRYLPKP